MAANEAREFDRERGAAGHMLDGVIVDLAGLKARTKHEPTKALLAKAIATCEHVNEELRKCVALLARVAEDQPGIGEAHRALAKVLTLPEDAHMVEVLTVARLTVEEVIRQQAEVPA